MKIYDFMIIVTTHFHAFPNSFQSFSLPKSSLVDHRHHCSVETDDPEPSRMAETENTAAGLVFLDVSMLMSILYTGMNIIYIHIHILVYIHIYHIIHTYVNMIKIDVQIWNDFV